MQCDEGLYEKLGELIFVAEVL